jgi:hypothetical protein
MTAIAVHGNPYAPVAPLGVVARLSRYLVTHASGT